MSIITYVLIARLFARAVISFRLRAIKQAHIRLLLVNDSRGYFTFKHNVQRLAAFRGESLLMRIPGWRFLSINNIISR